MEDELIRIVIADDQKYVVNGIKDLLSSNDKILVVATSTSIPGTKECVNNLKPDLVMIDLTWNDNVEPGYALIKSISENNPQVAIMAITNFKEYLIEAKQAGADTSYSKLQLADTESIVNLINETLHAHQSYRLKNNEESGLKNMPAGQELTPRELDILKYICIGATNREIAMKLTISEKTVKTHVRNILGKLGVKNRTEASREAVIRGLFQP
jgi:DNA-binding NarL/FixJ family response regulator